MSGVVQKEKKKGKYNLHLKQLNSLPAAYFCKKKQKNISNLIRKITFKYKDTFFRQLSFNVRIWSHELRISKMLTATHAAVIHAQ